MSIVITLLALSFVIFIHELGHMIFAKRAGIGVLEFSVGFGPSVFSKQKDDTLYSLRLFPLGGYVKLAGLDDDDDNNKTIPEEKKFRNAPLLGRIYTIVAGSFMNILLGFILFLCVISTVGVQRAQINQVLPESPAFHAGLQKGDVIIALNQTPVSNLMSDLIIPIQKSLGQALEIQFKRGEDLLSKEITPMQKKDSKKAVIGVVFGSTYERVDPLHTLYYAVKATRDTAFQVFQGLGLLIRGDVSMKEMAGPLGIIQFASFGLKRSIVSFIDIMALISISLGVINLFPFPVLDGGHLVLLICEGIRKKPISKKAELWINNIGATVLIGLMIFVIANDIISWSSRVTLLKGITP